MVVRGFFPVQLLSSPLVYLVVSCGELMRCRNVLFLCALAHKFPCLSSVRGPVPGKALRLPADYPPETLGERSSRRLAPRAGGGTHFLQSLHSFVPSLQPLPAQPPPQRPPPPFSATSPSASSTLVSAPAVGGHAAADIEAALELSAEGRLSTTPFVGVGTRRGGVA